MVADAMLGAQELLWAPEPYFDPVLTHRRRTCVELVRLLARRGTVRFTVEPKERVGLFAVRKDNGQNRGSSSMLGGAICGCAPVRTWRFSRVKASQSWKSEAWFGITDVKDCFHNMRIPDWFSDYFSLLHVAAWETEIEGSTLRQNGRRVFLGRDTSVTPALAVLPMRVLVVLVFCSERHNLPRTCTPQPLPSSRQVGGPVPWPTQGYPGILRVRRQSGSDCEDRAGARHGSEPM